MHASTNHTDVHLVHAEQHGWDVVCDYTAKLDPFLGEGTAVDKLIEKYSG